ncbi:MAG: hypothetical protein WKF67_07960 [Rubrobacteraceae bacterium]
MRLRWYNPAIRHFEWRELPETDEEALALLEWVPGSQPCVEVYRDWRKLGATVSASLIRAGEVARDSGTENHGGEENYDH